MSRVGYYLPFVILFFVVAGAAAAPDPLLITQKISNSPNSPLIIVSLTSSLDDLISELTVQNKSDVAVTSFQIEWVIAVPATCSTRKVEPIIHQPLVDRVRVEKRSTATTKNYGVSTVQLLAEGRKNGASLVDVQVRVARVYFEDGAEWVAQPTGPVFDQASFDSRSKMCSGGKLTPDAIPPSTPCGTGPPPQAADPNFPCHYFCQGSQDDQYCENHSSSCTNTLCPNPGNCAHQACSIACEY